MKQQGFKTDRIGGISDGVFAIAMTLLVLELKLPEMRETVSQDVFYKILLNQLPHFTSWVISFAILCRLWIIHHALLEGKTDKSRSFTALNFVFLGAVSFIPFPTSLVSEHSNQLLSIIIFSFVILVAWIALAGMWWHERKKEPTEADNEISRTRRIIMTMPVIAVGACLLALIEPRFGILVWIVFPLTGQIFRPWRIDARKQ